MEFKKKTIIWEDNNEPPKDYIWVKSDGKAYEFDYKDRTWKENDIFNGCNDNESGNSSINLDDIVNFLHENIDWAEFPYTKYEDIPEYNIGSTLVPGFFKNVDIVADGYVSVPILNVPSGLIAYVTEENPAGLK